MKFLKNKKVHQNIKFILMCVAEFLVISFYIVFYLFRVFLNEYRLCSKKKITNLLDTHVNVDLHRIAKWLSM